MELDNTRLYITKDANNWQDKVSRNYENISTCNYTIVENGYILPFVRLQSSANESINNVYSGGVQNEDGQFVAGHRRTAKDELNYCCTSTYMIDKDCINYFNEDIIYGGMLIGMFGHAFTESLGRLWYVLENEQNLRIAFGLSSDIEHVPNYFYDFMELLGINREQILIIDQPMRFKSIIVPDQTCINYIGYHSKVCGIYKTMMATAQKLLSLTNLNECSQRRIYLSRVQFVKDGNNDCINESYFEEFYKRRGYEIISPESLSICEQVALISTASEVVCTGGTLSHLLLFGKNGTKLTILLRCNEASALIPQFIINQIKHLDVCIVDCSYNYLPTTHAGGVFLMGPTKDFINYLEHEKIAFLPEEVQMDFEQTAWPYITSWINNYSRNRYPYKRINKQDIFDVVNRMSEVLLNKPLTRKQMATPIKSNVSHNEFNEIKNYCESIKPFAGQYYT